jgi:hypothetical protein
MKNIVLAVLLVYVSASHAGDMVEPRINKSEMWRVTAHANYFGGKPLKFKIVDAGTAEVSLGDCVIKKSRDLPMNENGLSKVYQKFCVKRIGDKTIIDGWVFADDIVKDVDIDQQRKIDFGTPFNFSFNGGTQFEISTGDFKIYAEKVQLNKVNENRKKEVSRIQGRKTDI